MNRREILPISILVVIAAIACIFFASSYIFPPEPVDDKSAVKSDLDYLQTCIAAVLTTITDETESAAEELSSADSMYAPEVQPVLNELFSESGYAMSYAAITPNGTIAAVAPDTYANSVGINITESEPGRSIIQTKKPFFSDAFIAQEGFTGIEIALPVYSEDNVYKGSVLAMTNPSVFVGKIVNPIENEKDITVTVMQRDGFILYDQDTTQIGKNLFTDVPFTNYESLQALGNIISTNPTGSGEYTFYSSPDKSGNSVKKQADWDTVSSLDKEWRIILFKDVKQA